MDRVVQTYAGSERVALGAVSRRGLFRLAVLGAISAAGACLLPGCSASAPSHKSDTLNSTTLFAFDTVVTLSAYCDEETLQAAAERCAFFERKLSRTVEGSDVWNINHAQGSPVEVDGQTARLIERALDYSRASDGLFDITIGSVSCLWDFVEGIKPSDDAVAAALAHVDWRTVEVHGDSVRLSDPEAKIDLGGIAKGWIADDLVRLFKDAGCESAVINLGGNVAVLGSKPGGEAWNVGVQDPNASGSDVIASVRAMDASVVTSGLYERRFVSEGREYWHILDPRTGYPVQTDLASSSIVCSSSTDADAAATLLFLLGREQALRYLDSHESFEGLVVGSDGAVAQSAAAWFTVI